MNSLPPWSLHPSGGSRINKKDKHNKLDMLDCDQFNGEKLSRESGRSFHWKCNGSEVTLEQSLEGGEGESHVDKSVMLQVEAASYRRFMEHRLSAVDGVLHWGWVARGC